jgi:nitrogen fixation NifU-like protein
MFSAKLLDHFENPRNVGEVADATSRVRVENPVCGDILELSARVEQGRIAEIRFRAKGCVPAMACGSAVTELSLGKTLAQARAISQKEVLAAVGGVPEASGHAVSMAVEAITKLLAHAR